VPPLIDISKIKNVPIALFVGSLDQVSTFEDSKWLNETLGKTVVHYEVINNFSHFQFNEMN
jgi:alpha-beta hydrolase superfamily lysophospholipase